MPTIHPREKKTRDAENDLRTALAEIARKYELTRFEEISVVNRVLSDTIGTICKYAIRQERHGNTDKPGGWA